jgi:hypothetical protein
VDLEVDSSLAQLLSGCGNQHCGFSLAIGLRPILIDGTEYGTTKGAVQMASLTTSPFRSLKLSGGMLRLAEKREARPNLT